MMGLKTISDENKLTWRIKKYLNLKINKNKEFLKSKKELDEKIEYESEISKNKIYNYFEKIQNVINEDFSLTIMTDVSLSDIHNKTKISITKKDILLIIFSDKCYESYNISTKNTSSCWGEYKLKIKEINYDILINIISNWDNLTKNIEEEIKIYFQKIIQEQNQQLKKSMNELEILREFNY